jgi:hypothetical protein
VLKIYLSTNRLTGDYTLKSCFPDRFALVTPDKRGLNRSGQFFEGVLGQGKRAELSAEQRTEVWSRWDRGGPCTRWGAQRHQPMPVATAVVADLDSPGLDRISLLVHHGRCGGTLHRSLAEDAAAGAEGENRDFDVEGERSTRRTDMVCRTARHRVGCEKSARRTKLNFGSSKSLGDHHRSATLGTESRILASLAVDRIAPDLAVASRAASAPRTF